MRQLSPFASLVGRTVDWLLAEGRAYVAMAIIIVVFCYFRYWGACDGISNGGSCSREWISALGGWAAAIAAIFVVRPQLQTMRKQAASARAEQTIAANKVRIEKLIDLKDQIDQISNKESNDTKPISPGKQFKQLAKVIKSFARERSDADLRTVGFLLSSTLSAYVTTMIERLETAENREATEDEVTEEMFKVIHQLLRSEIEKIMKEQRDLKLIADCTLVAPI